LYNQTRKHLSRALQHTRQTNAVSSETQQTWAYAYNSHDLRPSLIGCFTLSIIKALVTPALLQ